MCGCRFPAFVTFMSPLRKIPSSASPARTDSDSPSEKVSSPFSPSASGNDHVTVSVSDIRIFLLCPRRLYYMNSAKGLRRSREAAGKAEKRFLPGPAEASLYFFADDPLKKYESAILKEALFDIPYRLAGSPEFREIIKAEFPEPLFSELLSFVVGASLSEILDDYSGTPETPGTPGTPGTLSAKQFYELQKRLHFSVPAVMMNLRKTKDAFGYRIFESLADPAEHDCLIISEKTGLSGTIPKILSVSINNGPECFVPYLIRTSKPPSDGVWESDRISAAAYLMLFEEGVRRRNEMSSRTKTEADTEHSAGHTVNDPAFGAAPCAVNDPAFGSDSRAVNDPAFGSDSRAVNDPGREMKYIRQDRPARIPAVFREKNDANIMRAGPLVFIDYLGEIRYAVIHLNDRKKVLRAVRRIKRIKGGEMPEKRHGKLCQSCIFRETCRPKEKTLLTLFGSRLRSV